MENSQDTVNETVEISVSDEVLTPSVNSIPPSIQPGSLGFTNIQSSTPVVIQQSQSETITQPIQTQQISTSGTQQPGTTSGTASISMERNDKGQFLPGNTESVGNQGGRPCEFCKRKKEVLQITHEYLDPILESANTQKPINPYMEALAIKIGVSDRTLENWVDKKTADNELEHAEFFQLVSLLNTCQKLFLKRRTLGRYNSHGAEFQLSRVHGLVETSKQILAGDSDNRLEIVVVEERKPTEE